MNLEHYLMGREYQEQGMDKCCNDDRLSAYKLKLAPTGTPQCN